MQPMDVLAEAIIRHREAQAAAVFAAVAVFGAAAVFRFRWPTGSIAANFACAALLAGLAGGSVTFVAKGYGERARAACVDALVEVAHGRVSWMESAFAADVRSHCGDRGFEVAAAAPGSVLVVENVYPDKWK